MAGIPPDIAASALQAGYTQMEASRNRDAARAGQQSARNQEAKAIDEHNNTVDTSEEGVQVFVDGGGGGGQGRSFDEEPNEEPVTEENGTEETDDEGTNLDITA